MDQAWFLLIIVAAFFVFSFLPQIMQRRRHIQELESIRPGDWVVTIGGIIGQVTELRGEEARLRVSPTTEITVMVQAVRSRIGGGRSWETASEEAEREDTPAGPNATL